MADNNTKEEKKKVPQVAGYDKGPRDFFRGSRGAMFKNFGVGQVKKGFTGFKRGSR